MDNLTSYYEFLNESSMDETFETDIKKSLLLFSDTIKKDFEESGGKFSIFYDFYEDPLKFYGLSLMSRQRVNEISVDDYSNCRFTLFSSSGYKDTNVEEGRKKLTYDRVSDIFDEKERYYFYDIVSGNRVENGAPDREHITDTITDDDGRNWFIIIIKNKPCSLVKTKSRQEGGKWVEAHLASTYTGWEESSHDIKLIVKKNNISIRSNNMIKQIVQSSDDDIFSVEEDINTLEKYDILIDDNIRLEVKKYSENDLWKDGKSEDVMLAEQCKLADRRTLEKIIGWYNEIYSHNKRTKEYRESLALLELPTDRAIANEFSIKQKPGDPPKIFEDSDICDNIRHFYNSKLEKLATAFNSVSKYRWMTGILGIYFAGDNRMDRRNDFLIKFLEDDGTVNINFEWKIVNEWLGFNRLKLFMNVDGDSWEYIQTEGNNFISVYKLKDYKVHKLNRKNGIINSVNGRFTYDNMSKLWIRD